MRINFCKILNKNSLLRMEKNNIDSLYKVVNNGIYYQ